MKVRPALREDAAALSSKLRRDDKREIAAAVEGEVAEVLAWNVQMSHPCYSVVDSDGLPVGLFGVIPDRNQERLGCVWLLGSDELVRNRIFFLRRSRLWLSKLHEHYDVLWNYVDVRNEAHVRWIAWCGFTFVRLIDRHGVEQTAFYEFESVRADAHRLDGQAS
jgi:hypothetical protein